MAQFLYKYSFGLVPFRSRTVRVPRVCRPLRFAIDGDQYCLWALVDPDSPQDRFITLAMYATGASVDESPTLRYRDSFQDGPCVWHVFEWLHRPKGEH
jgi:hypothetical protein